MPNWGYMVAGAALSLVGSAIVVADLYAPLHNLLNRIPRFNRAERGWEKLCQFEHRAKNGELYGMLTDGDTGFHEILRVILRKRPRYPASQISAIICNQVLSYRLGKGEVPYRYISLRRVRQSTPDVIGPSEQIEEWISEARLRLILLLGFALLFLGSVLNCIGSMR